MFSIDEVENEILVHIATLKNSAEVCELNTFSLDCLLSSYVILIDKFKGLVGANG